MRSLAFAKGDQGDVTTIMKLRVCVYGFPFTQCTNKPSSFEKKKGEMPSL